MTLDDIKALLSEIHETFRADGRNVHPSIDVGIVNGRLNYSFYIMEHTDSRCKAIFSRNLVYADEAEKAFADMRNFLTERNAEYERLAAVLGIPYAQAAE